MKTLVLGLIMACWMHIPSMACTTPSYSDLLLAINPSTYRECHIQVHPYRNEEPAVGPELPVRGYDYYCTLQCSSQEQQRIDDLHAAYAAWSNGALPMGRPSPPIAARPSTRDAAVAGGDAFIIIIILLYMFSNTAQLIMLPLIPVALLLMATPASAEQEPESTRGAPVASTMYPLILMLALGAVFARVMLGRRYRQAHGHARPPLLPAGVPPSDSPPGPPPTFSTEGFSTEIGPAVTEIGPAVLDIQVRDPTTNLPTVVNGYVLALSSASASGYLGIRENQKQSGTTYTARGAGSSSSLGDYDCRVTAALQRAIAVGADSAAQARHDHDLEAQLLPLGDIRDTDWADEWDQPEQSSGTAFAPAESEPLQISPAGVTLHLSERNSTGYTGVSATKVNRSRSANRTHSTEQWYSAKYKGRLLKRLGGVGEFRTVIEAAEAYARAFAEDPQGQAKVLRHGGAAQHGGACAAESARAAIAAASAYGHGVTDAVPRNDVSAAQSVAESLDEAAGVDELAIDVAALPLQPGDPGFDPAMQALLYLSQSTLPSPPPPRVQPPSPPSSPPSPPSSPPAPCQPVETADICRTPPLSPPAWPLRWFLLAAAPAHGACCPQESPTDGISFSAAHFLWAIMLLMLTALWCKRGPKARARNAIFDCVAYMFDRIAAFVATATAFDAAVVAVASTAVVAFAAVATAAAFDAVVAVASTDVITVSAAVVDAVVDATLPDVVAFAAAVASATAALISAVCSDKEGVVSMPLKVKKEGGAWTPGRGNRFNKEGAPRRSPTSTPRAPSSLARLLCSPRCRFWEAVIFSQGR